MEVDMDKAIEKAVDQAYVLFQTFGWQYYDGEPDRRRMEQMLRERVENVLEKDILASALGRFKVRRNDAGPGADEIEIFLDLASFLDE